MVATRLSSLVQVSDFDSHPCFRKLLGEGPSHCSCPILKFFRRLAAIDAGGLAAALFQRRFGLKARAICRRLGCRGKLRNCRGTGQVVWKQIAARVPRIRRTLPESPGIKLFSFRRRPVVAMRLKRVYHVWHLSRNGTMHRADGRASRAAPAQAIRQS